MFNDSLLAEVSETSASRKVQRGWLEWLFYDVQRQGNIVTNCRENDEENK